MIKYIILDFNFFIKLLYLSNLILLSFKHKEINFSHFKPSKGVISNILLLFKSNSSNSLKSTFLNTFISLTLN